MNGATKGFDPRFGGCRILGTVQNVESARRSFLGQLEALGLDRYVKATDEPDVDRPSVRFELRREFAREWAPDYDTTQLCQKLDLGTLGNSSDLEREIKLPPAKPGVYCLSASKARVTQEPPEGGYSPNFIWS